MINPRYHLESSRRVISPHILERDMHAEQRVDNQIHRPLQRRQFPGQLIPSGDAAANFTVELELLPKTIEEFVLSLDAQDTHGSADVVIPEMSSSCNGTGSHLVVANEEQDACGVGGITRLIECCLSDTATCVFGDDFLAQAQFRNGQLLDFKHLEGADARAWSVGAGETESGFAGHDDGSVEGGGGLEILGRSRTLCS